MGDILLLGKLQRVLTLNYLFHGGLKGIYFVEFLRDVTNQEYEYQLCTFMFFCLFSIFHIRNESIKYLLQSRSFSCLSLVAIPLL